MKDAVLEVSLERLKETLEEGIGMESRRFVADVLYNLCDNDRDLGSRGMPTTLPRLCSNAPVSPGT